MRANLAVRLLPSHCIESSGTGGLITVLAYALMLVVFFCELASFFQPQTTSSLVLEADQTAHMQINFDIDMHDIECRNLDVVVVDQLGQEVIRSSDKHYQLTDLDKAGRTTGVHKIRDSAYHDSEEHEEGLEHKRMAQKLEKEDGKKELDGDWADSHDGFNHKSFQHVITYHDYSLINFFAGWCSHCRDFAPKWQEISTAIKRDYGVPDKPDVFQVHPIKVNCVDFKQVCQDQGIDAFPTIRLYRWDGSFVRYEGQRNLGAILHWTGENVHAGNTDASKAWATHHEESEGGCNAKGILRVPRTPGHFELFAGGGDQNLLASMTNASHHVKHLSFSDPSDQGYHSTIRWANLPPEARSHEIPMNSRQFSTHAFHQSWEHHLKIVRTLTSAGATFQFSHYSRATTLNTSEIPQAKFFYDVEPFALDVRYEQKRWYDLATSLFAILGGLFVVMRLVTTGTLALLGGPSKKNGLIS